VESHLDALFSPTVTLPSGGYLVINQTEALVSIDINSGKATREHNIEDTASKTNLEACDEIARQLRLRDLAGLVVIDFIDMEENRNNRNVERRIKEALKNDRARIQVGRISHFGLLEMSRQRLRPGLMEGTFRTCPHCEGRGTMRSVSSCGLGVLRQIEDQLLKRAENLNVTCAREVAGYLLNEKRDSLLILEQTYGVTIFVMASLHDVKGTHAIIEKAADRENTPRRIATAAPVRMDSALTEEPEVEIVEETDDEEAEAPSTSNATGDAQNGEERGKGRRRRRGRRGGRRNERELNEDGSPVNAEGENSGDAEDDPQSNDERSFDGENGSTEPAEGDVETIGGDGESEGQDGEKPKPRRGRRDRFGRNRQNRDEKPAPTEGEVATTEGADPVEGGAPAEAIEVAPGDRPERGPRRGGRDGRRDKGERGPRRDRNEGGEKRERPSREPQLIVPTEPAFKLEIPDVIAEPEVRKWTPPAPTVQAEAAPKKGGWWNKLKS
jgi:ribonuclease E